MSGRSGNAETAVILLAHGSVDRIEDLEEFLQRVRGGRPLPPEAVREIGNRYRKVGGRSPLNEITRAQARALQAKLRENGGKYRTFVGMKFWYPSIEETAGALHAAGLRRWVGLPLTPQRSRLSTGVYRERLEGAAAKLSPRPKVRYAEGWHEDATVLDLFARRVKDALERFPEEIRDEVRIVLTAHSLPERIREWGDPYPQEVRETAEGVMERVGDRPWRVAYQSPGMTQEPWLGPEVPSVLEEIRDEGAQAVLIVPVGFVADHVEILYDIDVDYRERAEAMGLQLERTESFNDDPAFIEALARIVRKLR